MKNNFLLRHDTHHKQLHLSIIKLCLLVFRNQILPKIKNYHIQYKKIWFIATSNLIGLQVSPFLTHPKTCTRKFGASNRKHRMVKVERRLF